MNISQAPYSRTASFTPLAATLSVSALQLYLIPAGATTISVYQVSAAALTILAAANVAIASHWKPILVLLALVAVNMMSLAWSSDTRLGTVSIVYTILFVTISINTALAAQHRPRAVYRVLLIVALLASANSALVVLFRLSPSIEDQFLRSSIAKVLINPNALEAAIDGTEPNNVFDPQKAGGVFLNANTAALYTAVTSITAYYLSRILYFKTGAVLAATAYLAIPFTGSKAATILSVAMILLAWLARVLSKKYGATLIFWLLAFVFAVAATILTVSTMSLSTPEPIQDFSAQVASTTGVRILIWQHFIDVFSLAPILGQGFGGWQESFEIHASALGLSVAFPPHNTFIYLWSQSGIFAVLLGCIFMSTVLLFAKRLLVSPVREISLLGSAVGTVASWVFVHGMGENSGLLGDPRQQALFAALIGLAYQRSRSVGS